MDERLKKRTMKIVGIQFAVIIIFIIGLYILYPKIEVNVIGTNVRFRTINANVIVLSENPDFSNSRYLDFQGKNNITFNLKPGTYYWKASNGIIEGLSQEFTIESEVAMKVDIDDNSTKLMNVGNVKLNVTRNKQGMMVGHIILEPSEEEEIVNEGKYTGREHP
jgi:hypothetical protein